MSGKMNINYNESDFSQNLELINIETVDYINNNELDEHSLQSDHVSISDSSSDSDQSIITYFSKKNEPTASDHNGTKTESISNNFEYLKIKVKSMYPIQENETSADM